MLVSLLGLVGIQIYWISSVITERTIEFEENATRAIHQITHKLEEEEGEYLLSRFAGLKDFISPTYRQTTANYIGTIPGRNEAFSIRQNVLEETFTIPLNKLISSRQDSLQIKNYFQPNNLRSPLHRRSFLQPELFHKVRLERRKRPAGHPPHSSRGDRRHDPHPAARRSAGTHRHHR